MNNEVRFSTPLLTWNISHQLLFTFILLITFCSLSYYVRSDFFDDAYISYRYAHHLIEGYGLVWNIGDPPAEGFTNFFNTLLAAGLMWLGLQAEPIGLLVSILSAALMFFYLIRFAALNEMELLASFILLFAVAANPQLALQTSNGMETLTAAAMGAMLAYYAARIVILGATNVNLFKYFLAAFVACLTRPDLFLLAAAPLLVLLPSAPFRSWLVPLGCFIAAGVLFLTFKYFYFGGILPLPFYVKQGRILAR